MVSRTHPLARFRPGLAFVLMAILFGTLWLAGGASRGDVLGQVLVRAVAWIVLVVFALFGERNAPISRPVAWVLGGTLALALAQIVPLPPALWQALPSRALFAEAAAAIGQPQPWRPWSIAPDATVNAASSLVVPFSVLLLATGLRENERNWLPGMMLLLVALSSLVGLVQFSGISINNPLVNDTPGEVAGTFANRNHFAVFMALGCLIVPVWAFPARSARGWRVPAAIGMLLLFMLTILASGSRAGMIVGALGIVIGLVLVRSGVRHTLKRYPRWAGPALLAGTGVAIGGAVLLSVMAGRAVSIDRALLVDGTQDMRMRGLPVVWQIIRDYLPFGSGMGTFDPAFRIAEPFAVLKPTYFNHAHNDWLEILLESGLLAAVIAAAAVGWWAWASAKAWWIASDVRDVRSRLGSGALLLVMIASAFDYPARTPMIMAVIVLAALWLDGQPGVSALPSARRPV